MDFNFYDLLYHGYTGEYQLVSALYRNGLDAVRPPADMGIDVVSLNLKQQLEHPGTAPETFFFQVKTALTSINSQSGEPGRLSTVYFKLKETEINLLCQGPDRALVCYVYNDENSSLMNAYEAPFIGFWIDGGRLATIRENGAFYKTGNEEKLTLACQLRLPVRENGHWYAVVVDEHGAKIDGGYLGTIGSEQDFTQASDGADHYSVKGYLDFMRRPVEPQPDEFGFV